MRWPWSTSNTQQPRAGEQWPRRTARVSALLCDSAGRVALVQHVRQERGWSLIGGAIKEGEDPQETLTREIGQTTGLHREACELLVTEWVRADLVHSRPEGIDLIFAVRPLAPGEWDNVLLSQEELNGKRLTPVDDVDRWITHPSIRGVRAAMKARATGSHVFLPPAY